MLIKILLGTSILLHFFAASVALRLTKVTKYNLSWMLITAALIFMAARRCVEALPFFTDLRSQDFRLAFIWLGIASSLCFAIGVFLIGRIFKYIREVEIKKREYEKKLLTAVIETEEKERRRFANDLHDGLGPLLSSIKLSISSLHGEVTDRQRQRVLDNVELVVNEAIRSIKEISDNLSPHVLVHFGIEKALGNFINKVHVSGKLRIQTDFQLQGSRYGENVETVLYRVVCELIANTCQHSGGDKAWVRLWEESGHLKLTYRDNGKGFDPERVLEDTHEGSGQSNIRSRVASLKGQVRFENAPGKGIFVSLEIPTSK
ncbi:signal transduction histidine kinase [Breznakibacter xylanolyticus]|uniref:histidine kinase n=1 Tax=Breznakibacter xylanolyticus TaxID=990 RepID=A0A2W7NY07_9BACT|nr:ATP-binding protein [Breznakibacter xylanolyticus]MBN2742576.1 hypothetical protein [Marinilabiliaceae bacterium]PZX16082.1 signal transduction histidine kinase [Breznakibacter xylanolyticus]